MIEVSFDTACMLYLGIFLIIVIISWVVHQRGKNEVITFERARFVCEFCHASYLADAEKPINRCPQCHFFNSSKKKR